MVYSYGQRKGANAKMSCTLLVLAFGICAVCFTYGAQRFGNCIKYSPNELLPNATCYESDCMGINGTLYCIFWSCPDFSDLECHNPEVTPDGRCLQCPGTCVYGGEIFEVGGQFGAYDNLNSCTCTETGVNCTEKAVHDEFTFCDY